jgi:hypothetical protein
LASFLFKSKKLNVNCKPAAKALAVALSRPAQDDYPYRKPDYRFPALKTSNPHDIIGRK